MKTNINKGIIFMISSALSTCTGQLMWKLSASNGTFFLLIGFLLYGIGALLMIVAYRFGEVSVLQPMLSIGFVFSLLLAALILHETISMQKMIGIVLIIGGMIFLSKSGRGEDQ